MLRGGDEEEREGEKEKEEERDEEGEEEERKEEEEEEEKQRRKRKVEGILKAGPWRSSEHVHQDWTNGQQSTSRLRLDGAQTTT